MMNWSLVLVAMSLAATGLALAADPALSAEPNLAGTYWATEYHPTIQVLGGGPVPLNTAGQAEYASNRAGLKDGSLGDPVRTYCLPDAPPRLLSTPYPFQLFQVTPGQVTFVHELNDQVRVVPLNKPLPSDEVAGNLPTYEGYASARYEGDALVIESKGFNDQTFLDSSGLPHSDKLRTTERIRRIGNQLEDVVTVHDPVFYSKDWQARFAYQSRPGLRLQEYTCGEPHRDISRVKGITQVRAARAKGQFP